MVIIFSIISDTASVSCIMLSVLILLAASSLQKKHDTFSDIPMVEEKDIISKDHQAPQQAESMQAPQQSESMQEMSDANKYALDQMYGRRGTSIDDKMTEHRKRIGDRDRKATIAQIRGRRNNSLEPYYRQELSQHGSKRWWDPDPVLMRKASGEQMKTIMMGPSQYK
jgi:flagellar biosynthesis component FlhA